MNSFDLLADPVRRRIVELLSAEDLTAGQLGVVVMEEFAISQPAVSNQLRTLRTAAVVEARPSGARRIYHLVPDALTDMTDWVERYSRLWPQRMDALETELARGRREAGPSRSGRDSRQDDRAEQKSARRTRKAPSEGVA